MHTDTQKVQFYDIYVLEAIAIVSNPFIQMPFVKKKQTLR